MRPQRALPMLIPALGALLLSGCSLFGTSRIERVLLFERDLNESREYLYQNFLEANTAVYQDLATKDPVYTWDVWFPPAYPAGSGEYAITIIEDNGISVTTTVSGPEDFGLAKTLVFDMVSAGLDWYIDKLTLDGNVIVD